MRAVKTEQLLDVAKHKAVRQAVEYFVKRCKSLAGNEFFCPAHADGYCYLVGFLPKPGCLGNRRRNSRIKLFPDARHRKDIGW